MDISKDITRDQIIRIERGGTRSEYRGNIGRDQALSNRIGYIVNCIFSPNDTLYNRGLVSVLFEDII